MKNESIKKGRVMKMNGITGKIISGRVRKPSGSGSAGFLNVPLRILLSAALMFSHILPAGLGAGALLWGSLFFQVSPVQADIPQMINYQGRLTDGNGNPRTGSYDMIFRIFDASSGGAQLWTETWSGVNQVPVANGVFSIRLGSLAPIPLSVFNVSTPYLETVVAGETLSPRQRFLSSAFTFHTATLMGNTTGFFVSTAAVSQTIDGVKTFSAFPVKSGGLVPSAADEFVTKSYVDSAGGSTLYGSTGVWTAQQTFHRALYVSGTHFFVLTGNEGIGTTQPSSSLDVFNGSVTIRGTNAGLAVGGSNFAVSTAGNVGIGTSNPSAGRLQIFSAAGTSGIQVLVSTGTTRLFEVTGSSTTLQQAVFRGHTLVNSGEFTIGTASPITPPGGTNNSYLMVNSPSAGEAGVTFYKSGSQKWEMYVPGGSSDLYFWDTVDDRLVLRFGGNVGVGTPQPSAKFHVFSAAGSTGPQLWVSTGTKKLFEVTGSSITLGVPLVFPDGSVQDTAVSFSGGTPALTWTTFNAAGAASTYVRTDASIALFDASTPVSLGTAAPGSAGYAARRDHVHPAANIGGASTTGNLSYSKMPAGAGTWTVGGNLVINSAGYSTSFASNVVLTASALFSAPTSTASLGGLSSRGTVRTETQFLGQPNDSAAAPSFSWHGNTDLGMFRAGADTLGFATSGVERARITSGGNLGVGTGNVTSQFDVFNGSITVRGSNAGLAVGGSNFIVGTSGDVGIGTVRPAANLGILESAGSAYPLLNVSTGTTKLFEVTGSSVTIHASSRTILTGGYLGIGTLVPSEKLHLNGKIRFVSPLEDIDDGHAKIFVGTLPDAEARGGMPTGSWVEDYGASDYGIILQYGGGTDAGGIKITDDGVAVWGAGDTDLLRVVDEDYNVTRMVIGDNGNVGIGTDNANPTSLLDVLGGSVTIRGTNAGLAVQGPAIFGGNVGVGTQIPTSRLQVHSAAGAAGTQLVISTGTSRLFEIYGSSVQLRVPLVFSNGSVQATAGTNTSGWIDGGAAVRLQTDTDSVGAGTGAPSAKLHVFSPAGTAVPQLLVSTGTTKLFEVTGSSITFKTGGTIVFLSGNVGIGTDNPTEQLEISKSLFVQNEIYVGSNGSAAAPSYTWSTEPNTGMFLAASGVIGFATSGTETMRLAGNNVGVGTNNVSSKFDLYNGSVTVRGSNAGLAVGGSNFVVRTDGNVGVGTLLSGAKLHVYSAAGSASPQLVVTTGTVHLFEVNRSSIVVRVGAFKAGGGSWSTLSDVRLKKNVRTLDEALDQLLRLRGVTYEWKEPEKHYNLTGPQRGLIAQEVEDVFPEWVGTDEAGYKYLTFTGFEALSVEAIKTLKRKNDAVKEKNRELEKKNEELGEEVRRLLQRVKNLEKTMQ